MTHPDFQTPPDHIEPPATLSDSEFEELYGTTECMWDGKNPVPCFTCEHNKVCLDCIPLEVD